MPIYDEIVLHYDMLELNPPLEFSSWDDSEEVEIDVIEWDYTPGDDEVYSYFFDNLEKYDELKEFGEIETDEQEKACSDYINEHLPDLAEKYEEDLLEHFRDAAEEDARENYEPKE